MATSRRISRNATGTFHETGKLAGIISSNKTETQSIESIFTKEEGEDIPEHLRQIFQPGGEVVFEQEAGFPLAALSIREQRQFLAFLQRSSLHVAMEALALTKKYGHEAAQAFLIGEYDRTWQNAIFEIGKSFRSENAAKIFAKYAELITLAQDEASSIRNLLLSTKGQQKKFDIQSILDVLLRQSHDFLIKSLKNSQSPERMISSLEYLQAELLLFANTFLRSYKTATPEMPSLGWDDFRECGVNTKTPDELTDAEKKGMIRIHVENWGAELKNNPDRLRRSIESFTSAIENSEKLSHWIILARKNNILAFAKWEPRPQFGNNHVYVGALNVAPEIRGLNIGEAFIDTEIGELAKKYIIHAIVMPELTVGTRYVEAANSLIIGTSGGPEQEENDERKTRFSILRDDKTINEYKTRHMSQEEVIALPNTFAFDLRQPDAVSRMLETVQEKTAAGMVGTRYFSYPKGSTTRYITFEKKIEATEEEISDAW